MSNSLIHEDGWDILDRRTYAADYEQDLRHTAIVSTVVKGIGKLKLRIKVCRNAYDFQSWVTAEVWGEKGWLQVFKHPINSYPTLQSLSYVCRDTAQIIDAMTAAERSARETAERVLS